MGDIIEGVSSFYRKGLKSDCHIILHYPANHNYDKLVPQIMEAFQPPPFKVTYELDTSWASVTIDRGITKFGKDAFDKTTLDRDEIAWFSGTYHKLPYWPFKDQWKGNKDGPILLALNHKDFNENHPIVSKFFSKEDDDRLRSLVDNNKFFELGEHHSFENNLKLIANCKHIVGIEGGWTHVSHCMNAPFVIATNKRSLKIPLAVHTQHPRLRILETRDIDHFLKTK